MFEILSRVTSSAQKSRLAKLLLSRFAVRSRLVSIEIVQFFVFRCKDDALYVNTQFTTILK